MFVAEVRQERGARGEDRVAIDRFDDVWVIVAADGAGGTGSGAAAAELVCTLVRQAALVGTRGADAWRAVLTEIDERVAAGGLGGQSTAVVVEISGDRVCGASVGDTEAWLITERSLELTADQVRKPLLGTGKACPVSFGPIRARGRLLVATDGLFAYAKRAEIEATARGGTIDNAVDDLASRVVLGSGAYPDDLTIVLGEWPDSATRQP